MSAEEAEAACWGDVFVLDLESGADGFRFAVVGGGTSPGTAVASISGLSTVSAAFLFFFLAMVMALLLRDYIISSSVPTSNGMPNNVRRRTIY